jgi:hypothetical protein
MLPGHGRTSTGAARASGSRPMSAPRIAPMPDRRSHRGPHPQDAELFASRSWPALRAATYELGWLYARGYKQTSGLKLVGDRHALTQRQRAAVSRCACAPQLAELRRARSVECTALHGETLWIDGFNVLTTLEVALAGGVVLLGCDGALRDIAGVHGSYRRVEETLPALELVARLTQSLGVRACEWLFDQPVSNSGRSCALIRDYAQAEHLPWHARVVHNPDAPLSACDAVVASADGQILDRATRTFQLARACVERYLPAAFAVDLSVGEAP